MADHPLRRWRKARQITLQALAAQVGVKPSHLSEIENRNNNPSLALAARLSGATADDHGVPAVPLTEFVQSEHAQ